MFRASRITASGPAKAAALFESRLHELVQDLRLDPAPVLSWTEAASPSLTIDEGAVRLPRRLARFPREEPEEEVGERVAKALFRARWRLLAPALEAREREPDTSLAALADLGLDLDDLTALAGAEAALDEQARYAWMAAERSPARLELLLPPSPWPPLDTFRDAITLAREMCGLPLPEPELARDNGLRRGQARLRVRAVRTPVIGDSADGETATELDAYVLVRLMVRYAAMLLDPVMITKALLRADPGTIAMLPEMLRKANGPQLAAALRPLLEAGFGLPNAPALVQAVLAAPTVAETDGRRLALPGTVVVGGADFSRNALAARLRASIVPGALLRRAGGLGRTLSIWYLSREQADRLPIDDAPERACDTLAPLALPATRAEAVLLVPDGLGTRVWQVLRDELPELAVAEFAEWPDGLVQRPRGAIEVREIEVRERA
jgi:hypothetical protein